MASAGVVHQKPYYRVPVQNPIQSCTNCQLTLRNEAEYLAHIGMFPTHKVTPVTKLPCPSCGSEVALESGLFVEHFTGYSSDSRRVCPGSGTPA